MIIQIGNRIVPHDIEEILSYTGACALRVEYLSQICAPGRVSRVKPARSTLSQGKSFRRTYLVAVHNVRTHTEFLVDAGIQGKDKIKADIAQTAPFTTFRKLSDVMLPHILFIIVCYSISWSNILRYRSAYMQQTSPSEDAG